MSGIKLTKAQPEVTLNGAQRRFLDALSAGWERVNERHGAANDLVALGLAERRGGFFGMKNFAITPAGRAWLAANPSRKR